MGKSIYELLDERFGVRTRVTENPITDSIGTSSVIVLRADPNRLALVMFNLSANIIYVKPSHGVSSTNGIALAAGTGTLSATMEDDFSLPAMEWHAVAAGSSSAFFCLEVVSSP